MKTGTSLTTPSPSLEALSDALKKIVLMPDTAEEDKLLGIKATHLKFNFPEFYRIMSDEDKSLIDSAIERGAYITRMELLDLNKIGNK